MVVCRFAARAPRDGAAGVGDEMRALLAAGAAAFVVVATAGVVVA
jgi:hypothetical protein